MLQIRQPTPAHINDTPEIGDSFWYWYGTSGRRYIHSVYPVNCCPVLPGAVYLSVYRTADGRFEPLSIETASTVSQLSGTFTPAAGADEVHVHLLASSTEEARIIRADLREAVFGPALPEQPAPLVQHTLPSNAEHQLALQV